MKRWAIWLLGILISLVIAVGNNSLPAWAAQPLHYTELKFSPLPEIQIPNYVRYQLPNGLVVYLIEDHELPLVQGVALVRVGNRLEPANKVGLASLTGDLIRNGGTMLHKVDELNQLLEDRAASIESGIGTTTGSIRFRCLSADLANVLQLFAEVMQQPAFAPDKLDLLKKQYKGSIARRNDDPDEIASREFYKLIYGSTSPYARTVEYADLRRITRDDIVAFHHQYFRPDRILLGIVGDIDPETIQAQIQAIFGNWAPSSNLDARAKGSINQPDELPTVTQATPNGVFFIDQPQLTQSYVLIGHLGGMSNSPDYPALNVMNNVLNGYGGRLFNELRSRQGLAYSVFAYWDAEFDYPGVFIASGQTRSDATVPFVQGLIAELERLRRSRITPQELAYAKDSTLNSFVFKFQAPSQTLSRLLRYEYYGYPADFLTQYRRGVEATTIVDVERVARFYLKPENFVTLVVGNSREIQPPLTALATNDGITQLDITIPD